MIKNRMYMPILKWKKGERIALEELEDQQKSRISPILEIVDDVTPSSLIEDLLPHLENYPIFIDTQYLGDVGIEFLNELLDKSTQHNTPIYPVLYPEDFPDDVELISNKVDKILIRIPVPEDIDGMSYTEIFHEIKKWISNNPHTTFILFDLGVTKDKAEASSRYSELKSVLSNELLGEIEHIIVTSTSFPDQLTNLVAGEDLFIDRYEFKIFKKVYENTEFAALKDRLIYSDYGVTRFTDTEIDFSRLKYGVLPKARYTLDDKYWVLKGKKNNATKQTIRGHKNIAQDIYKSPHYFGEDFSSGDREIKERALEEKGPGNSTNWVTITANHHISVVLGQISNLLDS